RRQLRAGYLQLQRRASVVTAVAVAGAVTIAAIAAATFAVIIAARIGRAAAADNKSQQQCVQGQAVYVFWHGSPPANSRLSVAPRSVRGQRFLENLGRDENQQFQLFMLTGGAGE